MPVASERASLVKALSAVVLEGRRNNARRFLQGLSTQELRYIASYLGACLLESELRPRYVSRQDIACDILQYESGRTAGWRDAVSHDTEHKMILLLEYLSGCGCMVALKVTAGSA